LLEKILLVDVEHSKGVQLVLHILVSLELEVATRGELPQTLCWRETFFAFFPLQPLEEVLVEAAALQVHRREPGSSAALLLVPIHLNLLIHQDSVVRRLFINFLLLLVAIFSSKRQSSVFLSGEDHIEGPWKPCRAEQRGPRPALQPEERRGLSMLPDQQSALVVATSDENLLFLEAP